MKRKDLQHIQIKSVANTQKETKPDAVFQTAEGIALKPTYTEQDIQHVEHLDFGAGFLLLLIYLPTVATIRITNAWLAMLEKQVSPSIRWKI
jgi:hypothetical protein